jgi:SPW repeat
MAYRTYGHHYPIRSSVRQDWIIIVLAVWFFLSPWILLFGSNVPSAQVNAGAVHAVANAAWNAWVLSVIVFLVALSALGRMEIWQQWINLILGAWIFIAPWALGFATGPYPSAKWDHWIVGALIFLISASNLYSPTAPPEDTTGPRPTGQSTPRSR